MNVICVIVLVFIYFMLGSVSRCLINVDYIFKVLRVVSHLGDVGQSLGSTPCRICLWMSSEAQPLWCLVRVDELRGTTSSVSSLVWTASEVQPLWSLFVDGHL